MGDEDSPKSSEHRKGGLWRWIWRGFGHILFGRKNIDFEKRLQHLSKEEVAVHTRLKRRTHTWRRLARAIVVYSFVIETLALGFAILSTRSPDISWKQRAQRVSPVLAIPLLAAFIYSSCARYHQMKERKDQRTLERLRAERQARIDELKKLTNYYATQELIQRYDLDPTAKAAAASVLAAKLGAESGLNVAFKSAEGSESIPERTRAAAAMAADAAVAAATSSGLRQRKTPQGQQQVKEPEQNPILQALEAEVKGQKEREALERDAAIERAKGRVGTGAGLVARLAAMLVGEDPSQCYALICKHCHMHNGLAPKEDYQYITYYCPHCHTLNGNAHIVEGAENRRGAESETPAVVKTTTTTSSTSGTVSSSVAKAAPASAAAEGLSEAGESTEVNDHITESHEHDS